ncbi:MAG: lipid-binding SYLF domain-containing protein [Pseudomonadota bacterium]
MHSSDRASLSRRQMLSLGLATSALAVTGLATPAWAITTQEKIVDLSRLTIEEFMSDPQLADFQKFMKSAKGILIFPQMFKGGFILGAEGGNGVYLVKGADGSWSPPAFYTFAAGSIGLQVGGQVSQAVFTVMNEKTVNSLIGGQFKMGADASVAVGPIGAGTGASTTTDFKFDIYSFSKTVGLFGGGALDGAGIIVNKDYDKAYYGSEASSREILVDRKVFNPQADPLRQALPQ